jgi:hypothetical protein
VIRRRAAICLALVPVLLGLMAPAASGSFGFKPGAEGFASSATGEGGFVENRAGSHPVTLSTEVNFSLGPEAPGEPGVPFSDGDVKDLEIDLPPGLVENPAAVPQCSQAAFHMPRSSPFEASLAGESCPARTQIGTVEVRSSFGGGTARTFGVFNLDPPPGAPSALGFSPYGAPIVFIPHVRQADGEYGLTLVARNIPQLVNVNGLTLNIWGTPWNIVHNAQRGNCLNEAEPSFGWAKCSVGPPKVNPATAYLTLPTGCEGPLVFGIGASSWQQPAVRVGRTFAGQSLEGCSELSFEPTATGIVTDPAPPHRAASTSTSASTTATSSPRIGWRPHRSAGRW